MDNRPPETDAEKIARLEDERRALLALVLQNRAALQILLADIERAMVVLQLEPPR